MKDTWKGAFLIVWRCLLSAAISITGLYLALKWFGFKFLIVMILLFWGNNMSRDIGKGRSDE